MCAANISGSSCLTDFPFANRFHQRLRTPELVRDARTHPLEPLRVLRLFPEPTETHPMVTAKGEKVDGCPEGTDSPRHGTM